VVNRIKNRGFFLLCVLETCPLKGVLFERTLPSPRELLGLLPPPQSPLQHKIIRLRIIQESVIFANPKSTIKYHSTNQAMVGRIGAANILRKSKKVSNHTLLNTSPWSFLKKLNAGNKIKIYIWYTLSETPQYIAVDFYPKILYIISSMQMMRRQQV